MTQKEMQAQILKLTAENARLKSAGERSLHMQVSKKGALSLYGMGKWPVTLYKGQWRKLLGITEEISVFLDEHDAELSEKGDAPREAEASITPAEARRVQAINELMAEADDAGDPISPAMAAALAAQAR